MLKKLKNSFLVLVLALSMIGCVDQSGKSDNNNLTIAATSVAVTEILEALDVPADQVIGIPTTESYTVPKKYKKATELGTAMSPDMEVLSTLKPSLVLSPNSLEGDLASKYEKIGVSSSFLNLKSVAGIHGNHSGNHGGRNRGKGPAHPSGFRRSPQICGTELYCEAY